MSYETARNFWISRDKYPDYPNTKRRRLIDINFIVPFTEEANSILDLGCADGYLLVALREFTDIEKFYGYDISSKMIELLVSRWGDYKELYVKSCDFSKRIEFPKTSLTTSMGMFPYIFNQEDLDQILENIISNTLLVRVPCSTDGEDIYIDKYSDELKSNYSSVYRTPENYKKIFEKFFSEITISRAYEDSIESKYGTKHFFFVCRRNL
jgi:SAM-dependent methyltransferase